MTAKILKLPVTSPLVCSACGAAGSGSCGCGVAYVPPSQRAADAVTKTPGKSDRTIAADIGVSKDTVRRARPTGACAPVEEKRTGKDGKARKMPKKSKKPTKAQVAAAVAQATTQQFWEADVAVTMGDMIAMQASWSRKYGAWKTYPMPTYIMELIDQADEAWKAFVRDMQQGRKQK